MQFKQKLNVYYEIMIPNSMTCSSAVLEEEAVDGLDGVATRKVQGGTVENAYGT